MQDMNKWAAITIMVIAVCLCAILIMFIIEHETTNQVAIKNGLCRYAFEGWSKADSGHVVPQRGDL